MKSVTLGDNKKRGSAHTSGGTWHTYEIVVYDAAYELSILCHSCCVVYEQRKDARPAFRRDVNVKPTMLKMRIASNRACRKENKGVLMS